MFLNIIVSTLEERVYSQLQTLIHNQISFYIGFLFTRGTSRLSFLSILVVLSVEYSSNLPIAIQSFNSSPQFSSTGYAFIVKVLILIPVPFSLRTCVTELRGRKICLEGLGIFGSGAFFTGPVNSTNVSIPCDILFGEASKPLSISCNVHCLATVCGME